MYNTENMSFSPERPGPALPAIGVSLKRAHEREWLSAMPSVTWLEAMTDNYLKMGGQAFHNLQLLRARYTLSLHGVGLSLGSTDPLNRTYLDKLRNLVEAIEPAAVSEHLSWSGVAGQWFSELLPLPFTQEAVRHVAERILRVQDLLKRRILVENVSRYAAFADSDMPEWTFVAEVANHADCHLLLDVNNIYVSAKNEGFLPATYLSGMPWSRVKQVHLAGYADLGTYLLDDHGAAVAPAVWDLYDCVLAQKPGIATLVEWDNNSPSTRDLLAEAVKAAAHQRQIAA